MDDRYSNQLDRIEQKLNYLTQLFNIRGGQIMAAFDELQTEVAKVATIEQSAIALIQGIAAQLKAVGTPAQAQALAAQLDASATALAAAVAANTTPPTP